MNSQIIMEQVAMYMASLPCPPMPLMLSEGEGEKKYANSHDLIASLLLIAMAHGDLNLNNQRKARQMELTEKLLKQMSDPNINVDKAYSYFSEFTAGYICALANINTSVVFLPYIDVAKGDKVHKACCSWNRAQMIILKEEEEVNHSLDDKSFDELLALHCERFKCHS